jgi:hypothetical protein
MQQEILNKLHTALYPLSPLASDRERIIGDMGEVIWLQSLEKLLLALPEDVRFQVVAHLNEDRFDEALALVDATDVDADAIITETAAALMDKIVAVEA